MKSQNSQAKGVRKFQNLVEVIKYNGTIDSKNSIPPAVIMKVKLVYFVKGVDMKTRYTMISGAKIISNIFENYFFQNVKIHNIMKKNYDLHP